MELLAFEAFGEICAVRFSCGLKLLALSSFRREHAVIDVVNLAAVNYVNQCVE
ncbi:hypothetical protein F511_42549 [Dorcoceras hygrometricum]|uniref:Uncharacterized protein n=1 Tax=Dorcoceras hygrometricum TaxID=472368 RepID=A0A2Z7BG54_9LAMI|nr:hypothetical protein F511_42549 [Dorcoceras hygrometricum]